MRRHEYLGNMFESRKISAICWDIDGTLVDSEPTHHNALLNCAKSYGVELDHIPNDHFVGVHMGAVWQELQDLFGGKTDYDNWLAGIEACYADLFEQVEPMPEAIDTLHALASRFRQGAVSNSGRTIVDANLKRLGSGTLFQFSLSLDDVARGKPDPLPYRTACHIFDTDPAGVIAVEDSMSGVKSAAAAGLWTVSYRNPALPAHCNIDNLSELPTLLGVPDVQN